jgi:hypothetical protein
MFERCGFSALHTDSHQGFFQATYHSDVDCPVDATPLRFFRYGRTRLIFGGKGEMFCTVYNSRTEKTVS